MIFIFSVLLVDLYLPYHILLWLTGWSPSLTSILTSGGPVPLGDRSTLLHQAAAQGNVTLLSMLLNEEGLDINNLCKDGYTALYSAAANGHSGKMLTIINVQFFLLSKCILYVVLEICADWKHPSGSAMQLLTLGWITRSPFLLQRYQCEYLVCQVEKGQLFSKWLYGGEIGAFFPPVYTIGRCRQRFSRLTAIRRTLLNLTGDLFPSLLPFIFNLVLALVTSLMSPLHPYVEEKHCRFLGQLHKASVVNYAKHSEKRFL